MLWRRWLPVLQLEVSGRCQLTCAFCPCTLLAGQWQGRLFTWDDFSAHLIPHLRGIGLVHFQGWGEPLLNPSLFRMMAAARAAGCRVGFTTNGLLLDQEVCCEAIALKAEVLGVSLAGAQPATHAGLRRGSDLAAILANVAGLAAAKRRAGSGQPKILLSYLMTAANLHELPDFIDLAAAAGADEVVATNLDLTLAPAQEELKAFSAGAAAAERQAAVAEAQARAARHGLPLRVYPLSLRQDVLVCEARPLSYAFVNSQGQVSPCVYLGLPADGAIPRYFAGQPAPVEPCSFGHLRDGLPQALKSSACRAFRAPFRQRQALAAPLIPTAAPLAATADPPPAPPPCQGCYKLYGA